MITIRLESRIPWKTWRDSATSEWIGVCEPLGLTASGPSYMDLVKGIEEIQRLLFMDLLECGELNKFLAQHGWVPMSSSPIDNIDTLDPSGVEFDVPFELLANNAASERRSQRV